jgi:hypothetical protein
LPVPASHHIHSKNLDATNRHLLGREHDSVANLVTNGKLARHREGTDPLLLYGTHHRDGRACFQGRANLWIRNKIKRTHGRAPRVFDSAAAASNFVVGKSLALI